MVIPVYDEEDNLPLLYQRLTDVLEEAEPSYELDFVDDGSRDSSAEILQDFCDHGSGKINHGKKYGLC